MTRAVSSAHAGGSPPRASRDACQPAGPGVPLFDSARLQVITLAGHVTGSFGEEVATGLSAAAKHLPCRFFYDDVGSRLFEQICTFREPTQREPSTPSSNPPHATSSTRWGARSPCRNSAAATRARRGS